MIRGTNHCELTINTVIFKKSIEYSIYQVISDFLIQILFSVSLLNLRFYKSGNSLYFKQKHQ